MIRDWWSRARSSRSDEEFSLKIEEIPVDQISPSPFQPRRAFDEAQLRELSESIRQMGVIEPIVVRDRPDGSAGYQLVVGERRWRASRQAGRETVPALIRKVDDREVALLALTENLQREELHYLEEALAFRRIIEEFELTQQELAEQLGIKQSTVSNKLRLLGLPDELRSRIRHSRLGERHVRALLRLPDLESQVEVFERALEKDLSARDTEELVARILRGENLADPRGQRVRGVIRDLRIFINGLNQTVRAMRESGLEVEVQEEDLGEFYEVTIHIAKGGKGQSTVGEASDVSGE